MTRPDVRREALVDLRQAERIEENAERVSWWYIAGLTAFCLVMFLAVMVAMPIVLTGLSHVR